MTFEDYVVNAAEYHRKYPEQRIGQAYFNYLWGAAESDHVHLADEIAGTDIDPFYVDARLPDFLDFVEKHW